jgi:hypothetical protein
LQIIPNTVWHELALPDAIDLNRNRNRELRLVAPTLQENAVAAVEKRIRAGWIATLADRRLTSQRYAQDAKLYGCCVGVLPGPAPSGSRINGRRTSNRSSCIQSIARWVRSHCCGRRNLAMTRRRGGFSRICKPSRRYSRCTRLTTCCGPRCSRRRALLVIYWLGVRPRWRPPLQRSLRRPPERRLWASRLPPLTRRMACRSMSTSALLRLLKRKPAPH